MASVAWATRRRWRSSWPAPARLAVESDETRIDFRLHRYVDEKAEDAR